MAFQVLRKLWLACCVQGLFTTLLFIFSPLCCSLTKSDAITSTTVDRRIDVPCRLGSYTDHSPFALNMTNKAAFCIPNLYSPWSLGFDYPFVISFTVSIFQQVNNLPKANPSVVLLAIHPEVDGPATFIPFIGYTGMYHDDPSYCVWPRTSSPTAPSNVSAEITRLVDRTILIWLQIDMDPPFNSSSVKNIYNVTISYYHSKGLMSVHVGGDRMQQDVQAETTMSNLQLDIMYPRMSICHFSSMGHMLNLDKWNVKILEDDYRDGLWSGDPGNQGSSLAIILSSVFGSVAAIALTATAVYFYFNSKYRKWKNEQERLAKIMLGLPGVPTKVDFTDIKKATKNFHETMRLGNGGFGAVYRCTLPNYTSRTEQTVEVAVKKFMQEVEDRRYNDFLAEVSIINRLRHKNIVPLVGWSYNKGVPFLVYEYMTNGSLDQHLFRGGGHTDHSAIWQWDTRYSIVRDIATGLHYVHHEHEPMVLHRDIKASNIMLDSMFHARLGDFGIACTVAPNKSYVTGIAGTFGYIAPDYAMSHKATRQADIYAFGVLVLEIVTGKKNGDVPSADDHITDWVWRLHREGMLLEAVDSMLTSRDKKQEVVLIDEAIRLLLLGLTCTNPNPSNRPSMVEVVQIINKLAPTPEVPLERPIFVWPPEDWRTRNSMYSTAMTDWERSSASTIGLVQFSQELPPCSSTEKPASVRNGAASGSHTVTEIRSPPSDGATL